MLPCIAKGTFQNIVRLKILGWGDLPGLSRWALTFITWALIGVRQRETWEWRRKLRKDKSRD